MQDLREELRKLSAQALAELEKLSEPEELKNWHTTFLGRKGRMTTILRRLGELSESERPAIGQLANDIKISLAEAAQKREQRLQEREVSRELAAERTDLTLPGRPQQLGQLHPTTRVLTDLYAIFGRMGFQVFDSPEIESDEYNFQLLNLPPGHPARDMWDTFYTSLPGMVLRTHTSPGQIHAMRAFAPNPIRVILPGRCYRNEEVTARAEFMFHQLEGLAVGKGITFSNLKSVLFSFANELFGPGRQLRFRKSYFPFTEPSVEVDVDCVICGGNGCRLCKQTGWLEILGAGMVHPIVLQNGGYDPAEFSGFAFGMGPDRIALLKYGIDDIRYLFSNDVRLLDLLA